MPLPLTVSCFSKIQIGFTFLVLAHPGSPGQRAGKRVLLLTLSGGDHAAVVGCEEHLRLAVFGHEYLVLAGGAVAGLDHGVATHGSQVAAGDIT